MSSFQIDRNKHHNPVCRQSVSHKHLTRQKESNYTLADNFAKDSSSNKCTCSKSSTDC